MADCIGLSDAIRAVLKAADDSLSVRQVTDLLTALVPPMFPEAASVGAILRQRAAASEFVKAEIQGLACFTINPEFEYSRGKHSKPQRPSDTGTPPAMSQVNASAPTAASAAAPAVIKPAPLKLSPVIERPSEAAVTEAAVPLRGLPTSPYLFSVPEVSNAAAPAATGYQRRPPLALGDRLDAIANDLEEAIADACDAHMSHDLIKALVLASGAAHRALQKLGA